MLLRSGRKAIARALSHRLQGAAPVPLPPGSEAVTLEQVQKFIALKCNEAIVGTTTLRSISCHAEDDSYAGCARLFVNVYDWTHRHVLLVKFRKDIDDDGLSQL